MRFVFPVGLAIEELWCLLPLLLHGPVFFLVTQSIFCTPYNESLHSTPPLSSVSVLGKRLSRPHFSQPQFRSTLVHDPKPRAYCSHPRAACRISRRSERNDAIDRPSRAEQSVFHRNCSSCPERAPVSSEGVESGGCNNLRNLCRFAKPSPWHARGL